MGGIGVQVVAAGSNVAKFNRRRAKDPAHLVISDDSDVDLSRTNNGCFSSMAEVVERDPSCVSCTTFNILAPIYKRLDPQVLCSVQRVLQSVCSRYIEMHMQDYLF